MFSFLLTILVIIACLPIYTQSLAPSPQSSSSNKSRREFIDNSLSFGIATATTASSTYPAFASEELTKTQAATPLSLPPLGLGAWAWGDSLFWGYNPKNDDDLKEVFDYALSKNLAFFDTAELYGIGRSESLLGKFRKESCTTTEDFNKVQIASKFAALPWRTKREDVVKACKASVKRLG